MSGQQENSEPSRGIRRRTFLIAGSAGALTVGLGLWYLRSSTKPPETDEILKTVAQRLRFDDWRDVHREQWTWDRVVRGTHTSANCATACAWDLYVKEGIVWREEQSSPYKAPNDSVPDLNPRGCQKGCCYSDLSMGPSRVSYPMKRVGPRGGGGFKRISWEEALAEISEDLVDTLGERGGVGAVCEYGGHMDFGPTFAGALRFFRQIGVPVTDAAGFVGDIPVGCTITFGESTVGGSSDDWFRSDYIVIWGFNPSATRIPDAHYLHEARYRGAKVVVVSPDMNQSAPHADFWLPIRAGTDAALAMAACQVVLEENLHDEAYICEQTDLPFLIHRDTGRFLRESDVREGGHEEIFAIWDKGTQEPFWVPGSYGSKEKTLRLPEGIEPDLTGGGEVALANGTHSEVVTVFSLLQKRLESHTPETASRQTGIHPNVIRRFARDFAKAPAALILSSYGMCKNYHSDLVQRAQILLASLTGNHGRAGGGWRTGAYTGGEGMALVAMQDELSIASLVWLGVESLKNPKEVEERFRGIFISSTLFHAIHGGLAEEQTKPEHGDPLLPEGAAPYLKEALAKGHFGIGPSVDDDPPDVIINTCGNVLRHARMGNRLRDGLFKRARLVVDITFRMSETSRYCDILLPAAGWYEKCGLKYIPVHAPYVHLSDRAVDPLGESKPEWEIFGLLAKGVSEAAARKGVSSIRGFRGEECDLTQSFNRYTDDGRFGPEDDEEVLKFILSVMEGTRGITLEDLRREGGAIRLKSLGQGNGEGVRSPHNENEPIVPLLDYTVEKKSYPTLTGRQQFYIDHPWFLKLDEALPTHKEPPSAGGLHPFVLTGGHTRWSIHSVWRDHKLLLRLQRGEPVAFMNPQSAKERGIKDHDRVKVWNDLDAFEVRITISGAIRPDQIHIFHAWEPFQFKGGKSDHILSPSPIKITQLVGDYGHLYWTFGRYEPNGNDRDTRVDVVKIIEATG